MWKEFRVGTKGPTIAADNTDLSSGLTLASVFCFHLDIYPKKHLVHDFFQMDGPGGTMSQLPSNDIIL